VLVYVSFYADFGPNNLAHVIRFCELMQAKFRNPNLMSKKICLYSSFESDKRANAAFLMCCYMLIVQKRTPDEAFAPLVGATPPYTPYRDAGYGPATYHITILDCLRGLHKALQLGLVDLEGLDPDEYEFYEKVENGDLNWITDKFIAMASPKDDPPGAVQASMSAFVAQQQQAHRGYGEMLASGYGAVAGLVTRMAGVDGIGGGGSAAGIGVRPGTTVGAGQRLMPAYRIDDLVAHLSGKEVTTVVRLNNKLYERRRFVEAGMEHVELYFPDGTTPPDGILRRFLDLCETRTGVIAVHCKAGLGRTGTLIAAYLMKHYRFSAAEVIGLLRVLRPGSVVGPQQNYLQSMQTKLWRLHPASRLPSSVSMLRRPTFPTSQRFPASEAYAADAGTSRPVEFAAAIDDDEEDAAAGYANTQQSRGYGTAVSAVAARQHAEAAAAMAVMATAMADYEGAGIGSGAVAADGAAIPI
ncbi:Dual specificity protein phosphatase cdc14a, partial [Cladochytrium tenue]